MKNKIGLSSSDGCYDEPQKPAHTPTYTLNNLEAAIKENLINAPKNFQIQLTESRNKLKTAIAKAEGR